MWVSPSVLVKGVLVICIYLWMCHLNCRFTYPTIENHAESCPKVTNDASGVCTCNYDRPVSCLVTRTKWHVGTEESHTHEPCTYSWKCTLFCAKCRDPSPLWLLWHPLDGLWPWIVFLKELMNKACWALNILSVMTQHGHHHHHQS